MRGELATSLNTFKSLLATGLLLGAHSAGAVSRLDFEVTRDSGSVAQHVVIRHGLAWVKSAGGDSNLDILWDRQGEKLLLIDHRYREVTPITAERVQKLAQQVETVTPLLRGVSEQIKRLSPKQRAKWESMLGGIPLDQLDTARDEVRAARWSNTGRTKRVAGIACEQMKLAQRASATSEFCLANPRDLRLAEDDAATLESLLRFTRKLAAQADGLAGSLGFRIHGRNPGALAGIPIEIRQRNGKHDMTMRLRKIHPAEPDEMPLAVPTDYHLKPFNFW